MRLILLLCLLIGFSGPALARDCVVLLHGLARTAGSMDKMQRGLADAGFETVNVGYASRKHTIEELADTAIPQGIAACTEKPGVERIHFVTHSLGGILLRQYLSERWIENLGRVVMLGPPNQGSVAADELQDVPGFDWLNGPAGRQLGKGEDSVPLNLGPADFELGIIAGSRTIDPLTSTLLENPDDGRVSVDDTRLDGMSDFIVVEHSHAFMMRMREPIELTIRFLNTGSFEDRSAAEPKH